MDEYDAMAEAERAEMREDELKAEIERLRAELAQARAAEERAWRERNEAVNKVRAWEDVLVVEDLPTRMAPGREWGPGGEEAVSVPHITPRKLTEILDEVRRLRRSRKDA